jgi:hypothetical protein
MGDFRQKVFGTLSSVHNALDGIFRVFLKSIHMFLLEFDMGKFLYLHLILPIFSELTKP